MDLGVKDSSGPTCLLSASCATLRGIMFEDDPEPTVLRLEPAWYGQGILQRVARCHILGVTDLVSHDV
jgi:hypothetical protein